MLYCNLVNFVTIIKVLYSSIHFLRIETIIKITRITDNGRISGYSVPRFLDV